MSATKRYFEEVATIITTALEAENSNPYECVPFGYRIADSVEEAVMYALCDAEYDYIFEHLVGCWTECTVGCELEQRPLTFRAMATLLPMVSDACLEDCGYTRSPLSLVDWEWVEKSHS